MTRKSHVWVISNKFPTYQPSLIVGGRAQLIIKEISNLSGPERKKEKEEIKLLYRQ